MKSNRKYYIMIVVAAVIAAAFDVLSNDRALLFMQTKFEFPAKRLRIGLADFAKPERWLLIASRESPDQAVRLFGMFPGWFSIRPFNAPAERFYVFRVIDDPDKGTVTLIENDARQMNEVAEAMARMTGLRKNAAINSPGKRRTFRGHDAMEWQFPSGTTIDIPTLRVTILMQPSSTATEGAILILESG